MSDRRWPVRDRRGSRLPGWLGLMILMMIATNNRLLAVTGEEAKLGRRAASALMPVEEFLASPASQYFQAEDYERALAALEDLMRRYPEDPLLKRYVAICLDRMGRSGEAIDIFQTLLKESPDHLPTLYFLGQAYLRSGDESSARGSWEKVLEISQEAPYVEWARQALELLEARVIPAPPQPPRWSVRLRTGYEYDSNVILKPDDDTLSSTDDFDSNRYTINTRLGYQIFRGRDAAVDGHYEFQQTLHDDSLNEFNFTFQALGGGVRKLSRLKNRPVVWAAEYGLLTGFLDGNLFSLTNQWLLSADTRWTEKTRTVVYNRLAVSNFGPDGFRAADTSRDGFYPDLGVMHYRYFRDFTSYVFLEEEFNGGFADGDNFDRVGNTTRIGMHLPLISRLDLDFSTGFRFAAYPNFDSLSSGDLARRRDQEWDLYAALTYSVTPRLAFRGFYRFVHSVNPNNFFDYDRHIGGLELTFAQG